MTSAAHESARRHVLAQLTRRGATVFTPVSPLAGIDLLVRAGDGTYVEVQAVEGTTAHLAVSAARPRRDLVMACVSLVDGTAQETWLLPSGVVDRYADVPAGGTRTLAIEGELRQTLAAYREQWRLITEYGRFRSVATDPRALAVMLALEKQ